MLVSGGSARSFPLDRLKGETNDALCRNDRDAEDRRQLDAALYLVAGGIVAATHHYWNHLHSLKGWGSALLATVLWPLLLLGANLHIH